MKLHTTNKQPASTRGKMVIYQTEDVYQGKNKLSNGRLHMPYYADDLNWRRTGKGTPEIGRIYSYQIV